MVDGAGAGAIVASAHRAITVSPDVSPVSAMSFFNLAGKSPAGVSSTTGSNSLIGSLNLDTSVPSDPAAKRKSIFEPSSTTEARPSNMFGSALNPAGTSSAFGQSTTAPASNPSGNVFGGFGLNTSTGPNAGANTTTTAPASGNIFGSKTDNSGLGGFGKSSLFNTSQSAATSTTAPSLFNTATPTTTTNAASTSKPFSLFGGPTAASTSAPANTSIFGSTVGQGNTAQPINQPSGSTTQPRNREPAYFNGLLERQKKKVKLNTGSQSGQLGLLPSMNLDLGDLARRAQELSQKNQKTAQQSAKESRAHYLLSASGVDPVKAYRDFEKINEDVPSITPSSRSDLAEEGSAYLKGMQTKGREAMLRESLDRVYRDVDAFIEESLGIDFDEQKTRIMQHFGLVAQSDSADDPTASVSNFARSKANTKTKTGRRSIFGRSGLEKSLIGSAGSVAGGSFFGGQVAHMPTSLGKNQTVRDLRDKERRFMEKIEVLNNARSEERNYKILRELKEVEMSIPGDIPKQIIDGYTALENITKEDATESGLRERIYAKSHAQSMSQGSAPQLRKQILEGSRAFLEKSFFKSVLDQIQKNPKEAQLGGIPSALNQIRAYIRVRASKNDLAPDGAELKQIGDAGDYCWAIIFYLLRSGHTEAALSYVNNEEAFQSLDRRFVSYLMAYHASPDGRLGRKMQDMIDGEYQQRTRVAPKGTVDPYQIACYKIIGRCDLAQRNLDSVGQGVEDWIWLQFALARETDLTDDATGEIFGLEQIVETVAEIGQKHFQKGQADTANSYGTYFLMQVLAGMFEQAVDYLYSFTPVSAVHLAIALAYYGLLRVSDYQTAGNELCKSSNPSTIHRRLIFPVTFTTTQQPQINFVPLMAHYTTTFRAALPVRAVDYLALICLNSDLTPKDIGEVHTNACHECLRELCLETREFAALLGDIRSDGYRIQGAIEQRARIIRLNTSDQFVRFITSQAAAVADSRGQIADAVLLYHLCDDYDNVYAVLNRALADAVAVELGDEPLSLEPLQPRSSMAANDTASQGSQANSSLSLTQSTSSPLELARNMKSLYENGTNSRALNAISNQNRQTLAILLTMLEARAKIEAPPNQADYLHALEELNAIDILPLSAGGDISIIRKVATRFSSWPQLVTRCGGLIILWCVYAIGKERERLADSSSWEVAGMPENEIVKLRNHLAQMARDLMVFAGLVRYKLPSRVYDLLTRAGGDVGGY